MGQPITVVDAFTDSAFRGNPAAVCVLPTAGHPAPAASSPAESWMQAVAAEMNLSETAFVAPRPDGDYDLRWFTPTAEIDLCGHATLASVHLLGRDVRFHTKSGVLECRHRDDGAIEMDFPAIPVLPVSDPPDWAPALGLPPSRVVGAWSGGEWALVEVETAQDVRNMVPDRAAIVGLGGAAIVVATPGEGPEGQEVDSVCRVFVPGSGIDEDPVTGAAHCVIGPWLAARIGRTELIGYQASARGGTVGMQVSGDRVILRGRAVTVLEGTLHSDPPLGSA